MKFENKRKKRIIKFLNGKAFYAVLCACLIAIGAAAWTGVQGIKEMDESKNSQPNITQTPSDNLQLQLVPSKPQQPETDNTTSSEPTTQKPTTTESEQETPNDTQANTATYFINPVLGEIIKDFSDTELQYSITYCDMRLHKAVDIAAEAGTPVIAAGEGVVTAVYNDALYGGVVEIDHGNGITAKYCGLNSKPSVKKGDIVNSSIQIGAVDTIPCESVEQKHLHLEFYKDGKPVSPLKYITQ